MSAASMEELYHRNKRIREFMYKFREKDQITVMRDIALLGIELFEAMNQGLVHLRAEDVENTLATIREEGGVRLDKDDRIQPQRLSNGNGVHMGVESAQREYTSMSHHPQVNNYTQLHPHYAHQEVLVNNENFSRAQTVPNTVNYVGEPKMMPVAQNPYELSQSFTGRYPQQRQPIMRSNQEGNIQRLSLYEDSLNGGYFQGSRQGYHYPENLQKNLSETEDLLQKRKMETSRKRLNPKEQNIPAGIPSYISVKPDQDEKHLSKSPTRWELDNSIYEPKQVMIKINRQNTAEIERRNEAIEFGLNYPNWWGDSTEKRKPRPKTRSKTKSSEKHRDSDDSLDDDRYINPQRNTIVHDDKKYEKQKISSFMLGSKDQIRRDSSIRQSASFHHRQSRSPKKDSQGGDTSRSRGGIALHYHMKDLCGNKHDDRPITPAKYEIKEIVTSDRKGKSQDLTHEILTEYNITID